MLLLDIIYLLFCWDGVSHCQKDRLASKQAAGISLSLPLQHWDLGSQAYNTAPSIFFLVVWIQKIGLTSSCLQRKPFICWAISPSFILVHFYATGPKDVWSKVGVSVSHTCPLETKRAWHQSGKCCLVETHCIYLYATSLFWQFSSMPKNRKASLIDSYTPIT